MANIPEGMRKTIVVKSLFCEHCDYHVTLIDVVTGAVLVDGDYSHDKIEQRIEGFIAGMKFAGYHVRVLDTDYDHRCEYCQKHSC